MALNIVITKFEGQPKILIAPEAWTTREIVECEMDLGEWEELVEVYTLHDITGPQEQVLRGLTNIKGMEDAFDQLLASVFLAGRTW